MKISAIITGIIVFDFFPPSNNSELSLLLLSKVNLACGPAFYRSVICPEEIPCPKELIVQNGSLCRFCDLCVSYINENESCTTVKEDKTSKKQQLLCKKGLECKNGICMKSVSEPSCEIVAEWRKELKDSPDSADLFSNDLWIPACDEAGNYRKVQCKRKKCLCFDKSGTQLFGQAEKELSENMTCGCSNEMAVLKTVDHTRWMITPQEHCSRTGDFSEVQCINEICFCSNSSTGQVLGKVTKKQFMKLLPCYDPSEMGGRYESQCELQLMRTRSLRYQFHRKNIDIVGLENVDCDIDGTFKAKQCQTDRCVCVNREGAGMKSYDIERNRRDLEIYMKCDCARDEYDISTTHAHYRKMICDASGNFVLLQCFDYDDCYCVDNDGDIISRRLTRLDALKTDCYALLQHLQNHGSTTTTTTTATTSDCDDDYCDYDDD